MTVEFRNFEYRYDRQRKPIFVPNDLGYRIGRDIKRRVESAVVFHPMFFHLHRGGHVAALHAHRVHRYFAKIDLERYFYSIPRSKVQRALSSIGIKRSRHYAKWSCIRNPYLDPSYSLPYGFVQSPILATLVMAVSALGKHLRDAPANVTVSVYMDDISLSSDSMTDLRSFFDATLKCIDETNFIVNDAKVRLPGPALDLFNCNLQFERTVVLPERIAEFYAEAQSVLSCLAFDEYCVSVEDGNI